MNNDIIIMNHHEATNQSKSNDNIIAATSVTIPKYVVPTGKDNFIFSTGRPNMVPGGRTIVSPGSIIGCPG
ncbi:hypothetical protein Tco_0378874 [Tanacetum coccineum]